MAKASARPEVPACARDSLSALRAEIGLVHCESLRVSGKCGSLCPARLNRESFRRTLLLMGTRGLLVRRELYPIREFRAAAVVLRARYKLHV